MRMLPLTILALALSSGALGAVEKTASDEAIRLATEHLLGSSVRSKSANLQYRFRKAHVDKKGDTHVRFSQHINGVRVWGAEAITHMDSRKVFKEDTFKTFEGVQLNTQATLSETEALARVHAELAPTRGYAQQPTLEKVIYPVTAQQVHRFMTPEGQTPNAIEVSREVSSYHLAYHIKTLLENDQDGLKSVEYIVDAHTGRVLNTWSGMRTATPAKGAGKSRFDGKVTLDTTEVAPGQFELRDLTRPTEPQSFTGEMGNMVYDLGNQVFTSKTGIFKGTPYVDPDNTWGDALNYDGNGTQTENGQTVAVDVAFGIQSAWDYYKAVHGRDGFDGKGTATFANVHYGEDNAFWFDACNCMGFGGAGVGKPSNSTLDIVAHEFSHGFCFHSADLIYNDEMGGLNEANSDIMATMVEHWVRGGKKGSIIPDVAPGADWEMFKDAGKAVRFMYKPSLDDLSLAINKPHAYWWGAYSPDAWSPDLSHIDVHFSSGPMNRAFYFLSQGATVECVTSAPEYLPKGMKGIGNTNAARLWYSAMTQYVTPTSVYVDAREAMLRAAREMDAFEPYQGRRITRQDAIEAVQNAFAGVNVGLRADQLSGDAQAPTLENLEVEGNTGNILFKVNARDNCQVTLVEFYVDGLLVGTGERSGYDNFALNYDSSRLYNGQHQLSVKAFDRAGNIAYDDVAPFETINGSFELLQNNGFEAGSIRWDDNLIRFESSDEAFEGRHFVKLGGFGRASDLQTGRFLRYVVQQTSLPEEMVSANLTFWVNTESEEAPGAGGVDALNVMVVDLQDGVPYNLGQITNEESGKGWKQYRFDLDPALKGRPVIVQLYSTENEGNPTSWSVDDIRLTANVKAVNNCVLNGGFEAGANYWSGAREKIGTFPGIQPASGNQCLWLGGHEKRHQEQVYQVMNIPAAAEKVSLKFQLRIDTEEKTTKTPFDRLKVQVVDGSCVHTLATFSNLDAAKEYREVKLDLGAFKGRSIRLQFAVEEVGTLKTNFLLDNVSVDAQ